VLLILAYRFDVALITSDQFRSVKCRSLAHPSVIYAPTVNSMLNSQWYPCLSHGHIAAGHVDRFHHVVMNSVPYDYVINSVRELLQRVVRTSYSIIALAIPFILTLCIYHLIVKIYSYTALKCITHYLKIYY
jgi:hypothetical protein